LSPFLTSVSFFGKIIPWVKSDETTKGKQNKNQH
jgi:hypothetical protein